MTPNQITLARVAAAFAAVAVFYFCGRLLTADFVAIGLTVTAIALDGVDGHVARRRGLSTPLGAQLDILGDRIVENLFFTFFAVGGLVSLWVPVVFFARGAVTDFFRALAARSGRTVFGKDSMLESSWGRALVGSRASRAAYATLKCACFCYLGILLPLQHLPESWPGSASRDWLIAAGHLLAAAAVIFCILRAIPVLWDGRRYLTGLEKPASRMLPQVNR
jgi:CDP-diacylglycerol--glycerol-3-phosphate 3-phosphatidyltransferase